MVGDSRRRRSRRNSSSQSEVNKNNNKQLKSKILAATNRSDSSSREVNCNQSASSANDIVASFANHSRVSIGQLIRALTNPNRGIFPRGVSPKELFDFVCQLTEHQRISKSRNHLQVLLWRDVKLGKIRRLATGVYTVPEFYEQITDLKRAGQLEVTSQKKMSSDTPLISLVPNEFGRDQTSSTGNGRGPASEKRFNNESGSDMALDLTSRKTSGTDEKKHDFNRVNQSSLSSSSSSISSSQKRKRSENNNNRRRNDQKVTSGCSSSITSSITSTIDSVTAALKNSHHGSSQQPSSLLSATGSSKRNNQNKEKNNGGSSAKSQAQIGSTSGDRKTTSSPTLNEIAASMISSITAQQQQQQQSKNGNNFNESAAACEKHGKNDGSANSGNGNGNGNSETAGNASTLSNAEQQRKISSETNGSKKKKRIKMDHDLVAPSTQQENNAPATTPTSTASIEDFKASNHSHNNNNSNSTAPPQTEPVCFFCQMTSLESIVGEPELLLSCTSCQFNAHPTCMGYTSSLAERCRSYQWQCNDCKICSVCSTAEKPESLLLCDDCDRGYHMHCQEPPITEKPFGRWTCNECSEEASKKELANGEKFGSKHKKVKNLTKNVIEATKRNILIQNIVESIGGSDNSNSNNGNSHVNILNGGEQQNVSNNTNVMNVQTSKFVIPSIDDNPLIKKAAQEAERWSVDQVFTFISQLGFPEQANAFRREEIDGQALLLLKRNDVLSMLSLKLGPALKIYRRLSILQSLVSGLGEPDYAI